jgi:hypothetical protein
VGDAVTPMCRRALRVLRRFRHFQCLKVGSTPFGGAYGVGTLTSLDLVQGALDAVTIQPAAIVANDVICRLNP